MRNMVFTIHQIEDEICGAEDYAKHAARLKQENCEHWSSFKVMAKQELEHADKLSSIAAAIADAHTSELWMIEAERLMPWLIRVRMFVDGI